MHLHSACVCASKVNGEDGAEPDGVYVGCRTRKPRCHLGLIMRQCLVRQSSGEVRGIRTSCECTLSRSCVKCQVSTSLRVQLALCVNFEQHADELILSHCKTPDSGETQGLSVTCLEKAVSGPQKSLYTYKLEFSICFSIVLRVQPIQESKSPDVLFWFHFLQLVKSVISPNSPRIVLFLPQGSL